uniref:Uncharacterized protein n=1 Tax=Rhizophora mucronata TaxID=61149 RepID=A0A2P2IYR5_RHIMU
MAADLHYLRSLPVPLLTSALGLGGHSKY